MIDWRGFDVGRDHRWSSTSRAGARRRSTGCRPARPSVIEGAIRAPGTVIIQNAAGVLFTGSARVDVGGLVATSQVVDADRFQRDGRPADRRRRARAARASPTRARITVGEAGLAALVGGDVENAGAIVARRGTVALAAGTRTHHRPHRRRPGPDRRRRRRAASTNRGLIDAGDGRVLLTAGGAARRRSTPRSTPPASSAPTPAPATAGGSSSSAAAAARSGSPARSTPPAPAAGGDDHRHRRTGRTSRPAARIAARGGSDGGSVRLGGDRAGQRPAPPGRRRSTIAAGAELAADGATGGGGRVVAWSDGAHRRSTARISATGGAGGFVETSGRVRAGDRADGRGLARPRRRWLLDPRDVADRHDGARPAPARHAAAGAAPTRSAASRSQAALNGGSRRHRHHRRSPRCAACRATSPSPAAHLDRHRRPHGSRPSATSPSTPPSPPGTATSPPTPRRNLDVGRRRARGTGAAARSRSTAPGGRLLTDPRAQPATSRGDHRVAAHLTPHAGHRPGRPRAATDAARRQHPGRFRHRRRRHHRRAANPASRGGAQAGPVGPRRHRGRARAPSRIARRAIEVLAAAPPASFAEVVTGAGGAPRPPAGMIAVRDRARRREARIAALNGAA